MLENFFRQLTTDPDSISFSQSIDLIESLYDFTETAFRNGDKQNAAGKIMAPARFLPLLCYTVCQSLKLCRCLVIITEKMC